MTLINWQDFVWTHTHYLTALLTMLILSDFDHNLGSLLYRSNLERLIPVYSRYMTVCQKCIVRMYHDWTKKFDISECSRAKYVQLLPTAQGNLTCKHLKMELRGQSEGGMNSEWREAQLLCLMGDMFWLNNSRLPVTNSAITARKKSSGF